VIFLVVIFSLNGQPITADRPGLLFGSVTDCEAYYRRFEPSYEAVAERLGEHLGGVVSLLPACIDTRESA
jgi:hypothetical protein